MGKILLNLKQAEEQRIYVFMRLLQCEMYFFKNQKNYYWEHKSSLSQHFISPYVTAQCIKVDQADIIAFIPRHKYVIREFGYDNLLGIKKLRPSYISKNYSPWDSKVWPQRKLNTFSEHLTRAVHCSDICLIHILTLFSFKLSTLAFPKLNFEILIFGAPKLPEIRAS